MAQDDDKEQIYLQAKEISEQSGIEIEIVLEKYFNTAKKDAAIVKQEIFENTAIDLNTDPNIDINTETGANSNPETLADIVIRPEPLTEVTKIKQEKFAIRPAPIVNDNSQDEDKKSCKQDENSMITTDPAPAVRRSSRTRKTYRPQDFSYPSKKRKPIVVPIDEIRLNNATDQEPFRDRILHRVDFQKYHETTIKSEYDQQILALSRVTPRTMVDAFEYESKAFFVIGWLTTIRLFEYDRDKSSYFEVKRIPQRYIALGPELITSVHYDEGRLYYSYLTGTHSCLEVRDLKGEPICEPFSYDLIVKSIQSDRDYIYINTNKNVIYIHRKDFFEFVSYRVDLGSITLEPMIFIGACAQPHKPYMSSIIISATNNQLIVSKYSYLDIKLWQGYCLDCSFKTVSMIVRDKKIIIHRNATSQLDTTRTKVEIGRLEKLRGKDHSGKYFIHERTFCFSYSIVQIEKGIEDEIYLFGYTDIDGNRQYEVGIYDIKTQRPVFIRRLFNVSPDCKILAQKDHILVIKECQQYASLPRNSPQDKICLECGVSMNPEDFDDHERHPGIFRQLKIMINQHLKYNS